MGSCTKPYGSSRWRKWTTSGRSSSCLWVPVFFRLFEIDGPWLVSLLSDRLLCCSTQMSPSSLSRAWIKLARITILTGLQHRLQVTCRLLLVLAVSYLVCCLSGRTGQKVERQRTMLWVALTNRARFSIVYWRIFQQRFMLKRSHPRLGLETLAILYALPYALLMWGWVPCHMKVRSLSDIPLE